MAKNNIFNAAHFICQSMLKSFLSQPLFGNAPSSSSSVIFHTVSTSEMQVKRGHYRNYPKHLKTIMLTLGLNFQQMIYLNTFFIFPRLKELLTFHANGLQIRQFA